MLIINTGEMANHSSTQQEFLARLSEIMEANLENEQFGVSELAGVLGMSRSNLHRKVNSALNISASQYIREYRLEKAKELLHETSLTVSQITWKVGFGSSSYFIRCFREQYGYTPGESENHEKADENSKKKRFRFKFGKPDKSDVIVWSIVAIFLLNILVIVAGPKLGSSKKQEKTVAVLPFRNDSMDSTNTSFINGLMGDIINNLSNNPNLIVRSRTTTENYRDSHLTLSEIAREVKVNYIIEGSGQAYDSLIIMNIQLTNARSDKNIKSWRFQRTILKVSDIDDLQKEIVTGIVSQLQAGTKQKNWYDNISASNLQALKLYWEGMELQRVSYNNVKMARQAKEKFEQALKIDSTYVPPMVQLGWVCIGRGMNNFADRDLYQDSAFYYAHRALKFDNQSSSAYILLGRLYHITGNFEKAQENFKTALRYNPKESLLNLASLYFEKGDYAKATDMAYKQLINEKKTESKPGYWTLYFLKHRLELLGFNDESKKYNDLILNLNNDTTAWINNLMYTHLVSGNFDSIKIIADHWMTDDTLQLYWWQNLTWTVPWALLFSRNYEESFHWFQKYMYELAPKENISYNNDGLAFLYLKAGQNEIADSAFAASIKKLNHQIDLYYWQEMTIPYILLASVYSAMGEKEKAIETLRFNKSRHLLAVTELKYNPMFDNIRDETEFKAILASTERKYQKVQNEIAAIVRKYENQVESMTSE